MYLVNCLGAAVVVIVVVVVVVVVAVVVVVIVHFEKVPRMVVPTHTFQCRNQKVKTESLRSCRLLSCGRV